MALATPSQTLYKKTRSLSSSQVSMVFKENKKGTMYHHHPASCPEMLGQSLWGVRKVRDTFPVLRELLL